MTDEIAKVEALKTWQTKIVGGIEYVNPAELEAHPMNFRLHPTDQQSALTGSVEDLGWIDVIKVNRNTGRIVDGHLRVDLAVRNKQETVPVIYLDLTEEEERQALLSLDPIAAMAETDAENLEGLLRSVNSGNEKVQQFLSELAEEHGVIAPDFEPVLMDDGDRLDEKNKVTCPECGHEFRPG